MLSVSDGDMNTRTDDGRAQKITETALMLIKRLVVKGTQLFSPFLKNFFTSKQIY